MIFYLKSWVPSLSGYTEISELTIKQLTVLSKFLLNQDHVGISDSLDLILKDNLKNKEVFYALNKFDKWFIIMFLRAVCISPIIYVQTKKLDNVSCSVEFDILKILTKLSELAIIPISDLKIGDINISFECDKSLHSSDFPLCHLKSVDNDNKNLSSLRQLITKQKNLVNAIKIHLYSYENNYKDIFILESGKNIQLQPVPFRLTDETLFNFLKATFLPFCKSLYERKYSLLKNVKLTPEYIDNITYLESQIFLNSYYGEESKKLRKVNQ